MFSNTHYGGSVNTKKILLIYQSKLMQEMLKIVINKEPYVNLLLTRNNTNHLEKDIDRLHIDCVITQYSLWNSDVAKYQKAYENHPEVIFLAISRDAEKIYFKESIAKMNINLFEVFSWIRNDRVVQHSKINGSDTYR